MITLRATNLDGTKRDLDVFEGDPIRLDISAIESTSIGDVFGVSSQEFALPGTDNNQEFFGYLDNLGATPGIGLTKTVACQVLHDGQEIFTGKLYVTDILTDQHGDTIYNVVVVNETVDFKLAAQNLFLQDLDWQEFSHNLTYNNITSSWDDNLFSGSIVYPLVNYGYDQSDALSTQIIAGGGNKNFDNANFPLRVVDFKPAIKAKDVIDKIFDTVNYTYTSSFFDSADFQNIYVLSTQDDKNGLTFVNPVSQSFQLNKVGDSFQTLTDNFATKIVFGNEVFDNASNVVSSRFTADVDGLYTFYTSLNYAISGGIDTLPDILEINLYKNGTQLLGADTSVLLKGSTSGIAYLGPLSVNLLAGDYIEVWATRNYETGLGSRVFRVLGSVNSKFEGTGPGTVENGTVQVGKIFDPNAKVLDFLQGFIEKFNLVVEPVIGARNVLRIEPFNTWIDQGNVVNWTDKVDRNTKFSISHPLQSQPKTVTFSDIEDGDALNTYTKEKFDKIYGEYVYESDSDLALGERKVGTFFAPTPMKYIDGAANMVVPMLAQKSDGNVKTPYKFKPRLLYKVGLQDNPPQLRGYDPNTGTNAYGTYYISDEAGTIHPQTQWMLFHHNNAFPADFNTTLDLHFGNINNYSYHQKQFNARTKNSAFFTYWSFYVNELYDVDSRLLTCNIFLDPTEIPQIRLNDKIFIDGHYYRVNKINGANLIEEDTVEVELLKTLPRKLYYPRRRILGTLGESYKDLVVDWDTLGINGTVEYKDYETDVVFTGSIDLGKAAPKDGFTLYGADTVIWDTIKPVQAVFTAQEIQGNSTLDPSADKIKVTGDDNVVKASTTTVNVVGDANTVSEYGEFISIDGSNNTIQREVNNVTLTNANNNTITSGSANITLLNTLNTAVTASTYIAVLSDVGSDVDNNSNTGTTTLVGTRNVTVSGSINDVTIIGSENIQVTGGNYHVVIGKDDEINGNLNLDNYRFNTNVLNDTYLDDGIYYNRIGYEIDAYAGGTTFAYSGDGLFKYIYEITWDNISGSGKYTIELPGANDAQQQPGRSILFKCDSTITGSKSVDIKVVGGGNIEGGTTYTLDNPYQFVELRAGAENSRNEWRVIRSSTSIGTTIISGSDSYVSNVSFSSPNLVFTGQGSAFNGSVNISDITGSISGGGAYYDYDAQQIDLTGVKSVTTSEFASLMFNNGIGNSDNDILANCHPIALTNFNALETIGAGAFQNAGVSGSYTFPNLKTIGVNAFFLSSGSNVTARITEFTAPSCSYVGQRAFYDQDFLVSASFGSASTCKFIGPSAFISCDSLAWVYVPTLSGSDALGGDPAYDSTFLDVATGGTITIPSFYSQSYFGFPDADLDYLSTTKGWTINYV